MVISTRITTGTKKWSWKCPKKYPDYKLSWARFLFYRDWLAQCHACTDGVMLTDVKDAVFQAGEVFYSNNIHSTDCFLILFFSTDPFVAAVNLNQQAPLMFFEEHPYVKNTHWLTDTPVSSCKKYTVGETPVLCSGSTMGSREGIIDYINVMVVSVVRYVTQSDGYFYLHLMLSHN